MPDPAIRAALAERYDALWTSSVPKVRDGHAALDPLATQQHRDARRGATLLTRPTSAMADAIVAFLDALRAIEPAQYYQPRSDLHLTVLSMFTATADHEPHLAHLPTYAAAVAEAVDGVGPIAIDGIGVTLSPGAVLLQGFPRDGTLEHLRARLRTAIVARGLGDGLDRRYRLETAHLTLVRFTTPLGDPAHFVDALAAARDRTFGTSTIASLELVVSDWYQSAEHTRTIATYPLARHA